MSPLKSQFLEDYNSGKIVEKELDRRKRESKSRVNVLTDLNEGPGIDPTWPESKRELEPSKAEDIIKEALIEEKEKASRPPKEKEQITPKQSKEKLNDQAILLYPELKPLLKNKKLTIKQIRAKHGHYQSDKIYQKLCNVLVNKKLLIKHRKNGQICYELACNDTQRSLNKRALELWDSEFKQVFLEHGQCTNKEFRQFIKYAYSFPYVKNILRTLVKEGILDTKRSGMELVYFIKGVENVQDIENKVNGDVASNDVPVNKDNVLGFVALAIPKSELTIEEKGNKITARCDDENDFFSIYSAAKKTDYELAINARASENRYSIVMVKEAV